MKRTHGSFVKDILHQQCNVKVIYQIVGKFLITGSLLDKKHTSPPPPPNFSLKETGQDWRSSKNKQQASGNIYAEWLFRVGC
jgi:hypothetical protein